MLGENSIHKSGIKRHVGIRRPRRERQLKCVHRLAINHPHPRGRFIVFEQHAGILQSLFIALRRIHIILDFIRIFAQRLDKVPRNSIVDLVLSQFYLHIPDNNLLYW